MEKQTPKNKNDRQVQLPIDFNANVNSHTDSVKVISINRTSDRVRNSILHQILEKTKSF
jgi:hypothetical protein